MNVLLQTYAPDTLAGALADGYFIAQFKGAADSDRGWTFCGASMDKGAAILKARYGAESRYMRRVISPRGKIVFSIDGGAQ